MTEREKVIKGLECCINYTRSEPDCNNCPYRTWSDCANLYELHGDALELLKAQEAQRDYEVSVEMVEHCERYEPTYNADDGSM